MVDLPEEYLRIVGRTMSDQLLANSPLNNLPPGATMTSLPRNDS